VVSDDANEWEAYKSLKRKFFLMWLFYLPACFATFLISARIFGKGLAASMLVPAVVALIWVGLVLHWLFDSEHGNALGVR